MSTLNVESISHPTPGSNVTINGVTPASNNSLGPRNLIINGAMQVAQRSTAAVNNSSSVSTLTYETIDRWGYWASAGSDFSVQQVSDAPSGFAHSLKITSLAATSLASNSYHTIAQRIEAQNLYLTDIGTSTAKVLTLSFWVKASSAATYSVYAISSDYAESFTSTYTVNSANTWEQKTITIPGATSGFSATGSSAQLEVGFSLGAGSTYSTSTLNQWQTSSFKVNASSATNLVETNAATLQITGVQLEVGSVATPFEHRSYSDELEKCKRYYYLVARGQNISVGAGQGWSSGEVDIQVRFPVSMRTGPSLDMQGGANYFSIQGGGASSAYIDGNFNLQFGNTEGCNIYASPDTSLTVGNMYHIVMVSNDAYLAFNAEL